MKIKLRLVRGSEVSSFLFDRMAWKYRWVDRLIKNAPDGKLFFGDAFHKMMELIYTSANIDIATTRLKEWLDEKDTSAMDEVFYQELVELLDGVVSHYIDEYFRDDVQKMTVIATELRFAIPLYDDFTETLHDFAYEGTIDLLYLEDGVLKFKDYKSVSSIDRYVSNAILDRQISRYWWALTALCHGHGYVWQDDKWVHVRDSKVFAQLMNFNGPDEFIYDLVRKDVPHPPKKLKKGDFSKDKSQNTTYKLYLEAIQNAGYSEADYQDILEHFKEQGNKFFRRIPIKRNWTECVAAMGDFSKAAAEMLTVRGDIQNGNMSRVYWNITWDTPTFNAYYPLIQAQVKGEDAEMVKTLLYKTEEDYSEENEFIEVDA